jgi:hypothetical protein
MSMVSGARTPFHEANPNAPGTTVLESDVEIVELRRRKVYTGLSKIPLWVILEALPFVRALKL